MGLFPRGIRDRETVDLMTCALEQAWGEFEVKVVLTDAELEAAHAAMVLRMLAAVRNGERSVARLKLLALSAVNGRHPG